MMRVRLIALVAISLGVFDFVASDYVFAQVEEIVVTARKRVENIQNTPVAVSAFSSAFLQDHAMTKANEIGAFVPNMNFAITPSGSSDGANIFIRGVGQNDFVATTDPGVGLYLDGIYIGRMMGSLMDLADIKRVEVLRGPQGTLFGKNTIGGAVNIITTQPASEFSGRAELTVGRFGRLDGSMGFNVPLSENFFMRVSGVYRSNNGFARRILDGQRAGDDQDAGGRISFLWNASEDLKITLSADRTRRRAHPASHSVVPTPGVTEPYFVPQNPRELNATSITPFRDDTDVYGTSGTVDWDLGLMAIKSITAYRDTKQFVTTDYDGTLLVINENLINQKAWQLSQEFQFTGNSFNDKLNWIVGLYYFKEKVNWFNISVKGPNSIDPAFLGNIHGPIDPNIGSLDIVDQTTRNYSSYGHLTFSLTDRLHISGGLRYTDERKRAQVANPLVFAGQRPVSLSKNNVSPKVSIDFKPTEDIMLYASWSEGFRSGGINGRVVPSSLSADTYDPEKLTSYEVGFKSELLNRMLRLNAAAFYSVYKNYQTTTSAIDPITGGFFFPIDNVGDLDIRGFEVETTAALGTRTTLTASVGYTDEKVTRVDPNIVPGIFGMNSDLPLTPTWTASASAQHSIPLAGSGIFDGDLILAVDGNYKSAMRSFTIPFPNAIMGKNLIINSQVTFRPANAKWEFMLWGKNLTDETVYTFRQELGGFNMAIFQRPLEFGATFKVFFR